MFLLHLRLPVAGKVWTWHSWENEYAWTALAAAFNRPFSCRWTLDLGKPMAAKTTKIPQVNEQTKQLRSGQVSTGPYVPSLSETHQKALRFFFKTWSGLQQRSRNDRYRTKLRLWPWARWLHHGSHHLQLRALFLPTVEPKWSWSALKRVVWKSWISWKVW